jgi:hypothetical protein
LAGTPDGDPTFDYDTISDIILHLRYTAREGGEALRSAACQMSAGTAGPSELAGGTWAGTQAELPNATERGWASVK